MTNIGSVKKEKERENVTIIPREGEKGVNITCKVLVPFKTDKVKDNL